LALPNFQKDLVFQLNYILYSFEPPGLVPIQLIV